MIRDHPRFQQTAIIFVSAIHLERSRLYPRLSDGRRRLCAGPGRCRNPARQGEGLRRTPSQDESSSKRSTTSSKGVSPNAPPSCASTERQSILAREVDHRAKNALAVVQAIVRLTRAATSTSYLPRSRAASRRCRGPMRFSRMRAGKAPISHGSSMRSLRPIAARRRPHRRPRPRHRASADQRPGDRACVARACDQCRQAWRALIARRAGSCSPGSSSPI